MLERPTDYLILVETRIVLAGSINAIDHGVEMEMLANRNALVLRLAAGDNQTISVRT